MQVNPQEVSGAKASTARTRPTMASHRLDLPSICDSCGEAIGHAAVCRSLGDKQTDPVLRAALWDAAALLYEQAAQIERLAEALRDAATSMQTIADKAGRDEYLMTTDEVRGYANSRANAARADLAAQPAINGYICTVPDDCETLHWRGQILSMNELASVAREGEAMRKDADRYRWLRARWGRIADEYDGDSDQLVAIREADSHFEGWDVDPASLDRAIDAAMQRTSGGDHD